MAADLETGSLHEALINVGVVPTRGQASIGAEAASDEDAVLLGVRPGWGGGLSNAATIDLEPLDPEASMALMEGLLEGGVPDGLRDRIIGLAVLSAIACTSLLFAPADSRIRDARGTMVLSEPDARIVKKYMPPSDISGLRAR